jgi:predicted RNase H-like HicB family nuclease
VQQIQLVGIRAKSSVGTEGDQETNMHEILFLVEEDPEGGFTAQATGGTDSIFTDADTIDELKLAIMDALRCHFEDESQIPSFIRLHHVKDETIRYAPAS